MNEKTCLLNQEGFFQCEVKSISERAPMIQALLFYNLVTKNKR